MLTSVSAQHDTRVAVKSEKYRLRRQSRCTANGEDRCNMLLREK